MGSTTVAPWERRTQPLSVCLLPCFSIGHIKKLSAASSPNLCSSASVKCLWCWVMLNNADFIPAALLVLKNAVAEKEKSTSAGSAIFERNVRGTEGAGLKS